jgi:hypothetical protein
MDSTALKGDPPLGLKCQDRFRTADIFDEALGDTAVAFGLEEVEIGVDDLEFDG